MSISTACTVAHAYGEGFGMPRTWGRTPCGNPTVGYLCIVYPHDATTLLGNTRLRGEFVCAEHQRQARIFATAPYARIVTDLPVGRSRAVRPLRSA